MIADDGTQWNGSISEDILYGSRGLFSTELEAFFIYLFCVKIYHDAYRIGLIIIWVVRRKLVTIPILKPC